MDLGLDGNLDVVADEPVGVLERFLVVEIIDDAFPLSAFLLQPRAAYRLASTLTRGRYAAAGLFTVMLVPLLSPSGS